MNLYQKKLMDHYHHPYHRGQLQNPDFSSEEYNPSCGDLISIQGRIENDIINQIHFDGKGCIISQACASLLTQECEGKNISNILALTAQDIEALVGVSLGILRLKCALLPLQALQEGILHYQSPTK
jgi:nitrogen fixation protein NifU and related proteins